MQAPVLRPPPERAHRPRTLALALGRGARRRFAVLAAALALGLLAGTAQAASVSVYPVLITLDGSDAIAAMTVTNRGEEAVVMQASVNAWSIRDNEEHYEPTTALIVSPPVFEVAPGMSQIVRVGLSDTKPQAVEQSFRVFLEQAPATPGDTAAGDGTVEEPHAVQVMLRIGIPVFVKPSGAPEPELVWRAERLADGRLRIEAANRGNAHVRISRLALLDNGETLAHSEMPRYILPDSRRHWLLAAPTQTAAPYRIQAESNRGVLDTIITASAP